MAKSSNKSSSMKKIKGPFEKYNLFEKMNIDDNCWTTVEGVKVPAPGIFCWIYIFLIIFVNIVSLFGIKHYKQLGLNNTQIAVRYFFQFLFMFLSVTFMYSMCKRCRGLEGLLILILLSFVASLLALGPIITKLFADMRTTPDAPKGAKKSPKATKKNPKKSAKDAKA